MWGQDSWILATITVFPTPPPPPPHPPQKKLGQYTAILTEQAWSIDLCHAAAILSQETDRLTEEMNGWMNAWTNKQINTCMIFWQTDWRNEWMDGWMNARTNEQVNHWEMDQLYWASFRLCMQQECMNTWMIYWLTVLINEWTNERTTKRKSKLINERWISPSAFSPEHAGG